MCLGPGECGAGSGVRSLGRYRLRCGCSGRCVGGRGDDDEVLKVAEAGVALSCPQEGRPTVRRQGDWRVRGQAAALAARSAARFCGYLVIRYAENT